MNDYRRPAEYQISKIYRCAGCSAESETEGCYAPPVKCWSCGGRLVYVGESYPANSRDWDEERDNVNDQFRNRR